MLINILVNRYQAGEGIYDLFDKVMVMNKGHQVFFGPPAEARAYFENLGYKALPRQSTPDYLTGCTDPNERQFAPGRSVNDVPSTPEALETAFRQSSYGRDLDHSRESYKQLQQTDKSDQEAFRAAVAADKKKGVSKKNPYTLGFFQQVKLVTARQFQQKMQDSFSIQTSFFLNTVSRSLYAYVFSALTVSASSGLGSRHWRCILQPEQHFWQRFHQRRCDFHVAVGYLFGCFQ
jgi:ATP-binding cassette, subfamily G (WHITE), member 2, SNQ2